MKALIVLFLAVAYSPLSSAQPGLSVGAVAVELRATDDMIIAGSIGPRGATDMAKRYARW